MSVQDITDRADLGRGTFYIRFKHKGQVPWTAFQDLSGQLEREAHAELGHAVPQAEYFGLLNIFHDGDQNRDLYRVLLGSPGSAMLSGQARGFLARAFRDDIRHAPSPEVDFHLPAEFEAQFLTGIISGLLHWWLDSPSRYASQDMAAMTYEALCGKVPPAPAARRPPRHAAEAG